MTLKRIDDQEFLNEETGEILTRRGLHWLKMYLEAIPGLRTVLNAHGDVLFYLVEKMDKNNSVNKTRKAISKDTGYNSKYISRILEDLEDSRLISVEKRWIIVNPDFIWFGKEELKRQQTSAIFWDRVSKKTYMNHGKKTK